MKNSSLEQKRRNSFFRWNPLGVVSKSTTPPVEKKGRKFSLQRSISVPDGCSFSSVDHSAEVAERELYAREPFSKKYVKNHVSYLQASPEA
ncbi:MAG TPA: hypothetical protein PLY23_02060 [Alphaproteobacteria bacterium]|nr:hypothetical protein [Alphaproteobacteria bacterium]HQS93451.1 hypothetical protein [Alphaproteobacteria bacterium]